MPYPTLVACRHCDALFRRPRLLPGGQTACCSRCGSTLYRESAAQLDSLCAITVAALVTFIIAQAFPIIELDANGITSESSLIGALAVLWSQGMYAVASLVFCATVLFPLVEIVALLYLLLPIRRGVVPPGFRHVMHVIGFVRPWGMLEVFMVGILVAIVKLVSISRVMPQTALFAFAALTLMLTVVAMFDFRRLWEIADSLRAPLIGGDNDPGHYAPKLRSTRDSSAEGADGAAGHVTAKDAGLACCHVCGQLESWQLLARTPHTSHKQHKPRCTRCHAPMHLRRPDSLRRTWAFLSAAAILYIPANVLPIMNTATLAHDRGDTILSGIVHFWLTGEWLIASIVFIASIMVPMLKISALALLALTSQRRSRWRTAERTTLYRVVEVIGRWSMLDIFVIALTVALVRFGTFGTVTAGPGAIAFGAVVILTMLASMQFDPRLIWDPVSRAAPVAEEPSQYTMEHPHD
ncbi:MULTISPECIES: paraquat-inducible protein A [unclassified Paraburkholderia]|uniref:paraquat-inducible protein A n=1 Tax=unclassified Paraburkholderia TaxID=2615204 RepID=UPI002AB1EB9B|nr:MULTISPECIES: paraquat-inducible protein A [unclassified Paraburkholderia]